MSRFILKNFLILFIFSTTISFAQLYQGPAQGSVPGGVIVSTDDFPESPIISDPDGMVIRNKQDYVEEANYLEYLHSKAAKYFNDPAVSNTDATDEYSIKLNDFNGINMTNSIPPDPDIAVGPTHIIATVNSRFAIWDKEGNLVKNISANQWYLNTLPNPGAFDPIIVYDHFDKRWFMLWDNVDDAAQTAYFLISVSDDSIPTGVWHNWAIPSNVNGSTVVNNWSDYPGVGYDKDAIYINGRQFSFGGSYQYNKIRILDKAQLYAPTPGQLAWTDFWDIRNPDILSARPDVIRPVKVYGEPNEFYFLFANRTGANYVTLYRIVNSLTAPVLSAVNIGIPPYAASPNANQLGNGTPLISSNESHMKTAPVYRDGVIHAVHSISNPTSPAHSAVDYLKINVANNTLLESIRFGAPGYWYIFPAIMADKDHNIAIVYSRSADTEYIGSYYSTKLASHSSFSGSKLLQAGKGNYVVTYGTTRNRWGDYLGTGLDPSNDYDIFMIGQHAAATNTWGTHIGHIRMGTYEGAHIVNTSPKLEFGNIEVAYSSDTLSTILYNWGNQNLTISSLPDSVGPFKLVSNLTTPITLASYEHITLEFVFMPSQPAVYDLTYQLNSNDPNFGGINLKARGYEINPANEGIIFASTGASQNSEILTLELPSGTGSLLGSSLQNEVSAIAVHPVTKIIYSAVARSSNATILRTNASGGDSYNLFDVNIPNLTSLAFDTLGNFYGASRNGIIFNIDIANNTADSVVSAAAGINSMAFHPATNDLWVSAFQLAPVNRDRVFIVDLATGDTIVIGNTGLNSLNNGLTFDEVGNLYSVVGSPTQNNDFVSINTLTGTGTVIGTTGFKNITGISYSGGETVSVGDDVSSSLPSDFSLSQNYPNPFNPVTTIEFALPVNADVKLTIYNILGQAVNVLVNNNLSAGYHKINWNSNNSSGVKLSSGIYFYEIKAEGVNGNEFSQMKKMILMK